MYQIRALSLPDDYQRLADLYNARRLVSHCRDRFAAVDETGLMVGYADAWRAPWTPPGEMVVSFVVEPDHAGRGLEQLLLDRAEATAAEKGAALVKAQVPESDAEAVTQRGYAIERHLFESSLEPRPVHL